MAKKTRNGEMKTTDYRHTGEKRTNNPPARIAAGARCRRCRRCATGPAPTYRPS